MKPPSAVPCSLLLLGLGLLAASPALGRTWRVDAGGSGDFVSIQAAIEAASDGDSIVVSGGTYEERLDLEGKVLDLIGEKGSTQTIVDAGGSGSVIRVPFTPTGIPHIRGFTFMNGNGTILSVPPQNFRYGGGTLVDTASPRFEECLFTGNVANFGGGAFVLAGAPVFVRCRFTGNDAGNGGGFSAQHDSGARLEDCEVDDNSGVFGGGIDLFRSRLVVDGCRIRANVAYEGGGVRAVDRDFTQVRIQGSLVAGNAASRGGAVYAWEALLGIARSTIARNLTDPDGGSVQLLDSDLFLEQTIVESSEEAPLIACEGLAPRLECILLWGPLPGEPECLAGDGVLLADPLFCDPAEGDFTVREDSPCLPGLGPEGCDLIGAFGRGCLAPVPVRTRSWGALKEIFR